ncbi:MAG: Flp pilus assembly protein CpaB [Thermosediminibacteraceae bacterium]|nr:Flp pilus assembly protein CpaB [Thermosediminibacteraceae bacterium]
MKNKLIFILALIFALAAGYGVYDYMGEIKAFYGSSENLKTVVVAKKKIPPRMIITEDMIEVREIPSAYVVEGAVAEKKDAVGKLSRTEIYPGELLLAGKLLDRKTTGAGLSAKVEPGKRAISIPVDNVMGLHGLINTGDRVDIIVTFELPGEKTPISATVVQNVPVLAVNANLETPTQLKEEPKTVTVMVEPREAQKIALAIQQGSIQLVLRSPQDNNKNPVSPVNLQKLIE